MCMWQSQPWRHRALRFASSHSRKRMFLFLRCQKITLRDPKVCGFRPGSFKTNEQKSQTWNLCNPSVSQGQSHTDTRNRSHGFVTQSAWSAIRTPLKALRKLFKGSTKFTNRLLRLIFLAFTNMIIKSSWTHAAYLFLYVDFSCCRDNGPPSLSGSSGVACFTQTCHTKALRLRMMFMSFKRLALLPLWHADFWKLAVICAFIIVSYINDNGGLFRFVLLYRHANFRCNGQSTQQNKSYPPPTNIQTQTQQTSIIVNVKLCSLQM